MSGFGANAERSVTMQINSLPPSHNVLRRKYRHFAAYGRLKAAWMNDLRYSCQRWEAQWLTSMVGLGKKMRVRILLQHGKLYDVDNAYASCKPVLDAMVELGFLKDDSPKYLELVVDQEQIRAKSVKIMVSEAG